MRRSIHSYIRLVPLMASALMSLAVFAAPAKCGDGEVIIPTGRLAISKTQESVQMVVTTSQYLTFPQPILKATIQNDSAIQVQASGRNEVLVSAMATGVAQIDLLGADDQVYNVQVIVTGDARELKAILAQQFPSATLSVVPIQQAVIISGTVTADEHVEQAVTIAEQYYGTVINRIEVIGVHTIMLPNSGDGSIANQIATTRYRLVLGIWKRLRHAICKRTTWNRHDSNAA